MAGLDLASEPVLVGYSLGADLVVHYASEHPGSFAELVLIDGANPVPEPFITEADLPEFRAMMEGVALDEAKSGSWLEADHRLVFTHAPEIAGLIRGATDTAGGS